MSRRINKMVQFGKKTPKKQPDTAQQIAIRISRSFLRQLVRDDFFSGTEMSFTPVLKNQFDTAFRGLVSKNSGISSNVWPLVIDHVGNFAEEAFRFKQSTGALAWTDAAIMIEGFNWQGVVK